MKTDSSLILVCLWLMTAPALAGNALVWEPKDN